MRYGSVCSGIEAATVAWAPLGWKASFFSEIEAFPRAVLAHHYPNVPLHGDFTTIKGSEYEPIDLLVGGTPCQSFSVAGLRGGLDDDRGNLALEFLRLADRTRPRWLVWENVPGVLSSNGGRDFGSILGGMVELGYGIAYRVLDAQYFGVAQRRRRVFVVGYLGDWRRAAAVLFERHSLQGHSPPRREKGKGTARAAEEGPGASRNPSQPGSLSHWDGPEHPHPTLTQSARGSGGVGSSNQEVFAQRGAYLAADVSHTLNAGKMERRDAETETFIAQVSGTLNANGKAAGSATQQDAETGMLIAFHAEAQADQLPTAGRDTNISDSLTTSQHAAVAFEGDVARTLSARHDGSPCADRGPNVVAVPQTPPTLTSNGDAHSGYRDEHGLAPVGIFQDSEFGVAQYDSAGTLRAGRIPEHQMVMQPQAVAVPFDLAQITSKTNRSRVEDGLPAGTLSKESQMHVAMAFQSSQSGMRTGDTHATLDANNGSRRHNGVMVPVAFAQNTRDEVREMPVIGALAAQPGMKQTSYVRTAMQVRRLTPRECERLQGFPDDYTLIPHRNKPAADGPRYKALGNSMAVPVMRWIGERIQIVEKLNIKSG